MCAQWLKQAEVRVCEIMISVKAYRRMTANGPAYWAIGLLRFSGEQEPQQGNAFVQLI